MQLQETETYTTIVYTIEHEGKIYKAVKSDDPFESMKVEWILVDDETESEMFEDNPLYNQILNFLNDTGPAVDGAGFTADDATAEDNHRNELAKELAIMSIDRVEREDFDVRIVDYLNNPKDYDIDEESKFYEALQAAYDNRDEMYERYVKQFKSK
jgi:hypothetical protein